MRFHRCSRYWAARDFSSRSAVERPLKPSSSLSALAAFMSCNSTIARSRARSAMSGRERFMVHVLGRFRLLTGDAPITIPPRLRKPQELLQALIAFGGTEVSAGVLIDALWPDSEGDAAYHALESALYRLRQLLGARDAVRMEGGKVSLNRDQLWVDMWEFEEELQRPHGPEANDIERIGRLRLLYRGHFLQHETEKPWVLKARQEDRK